MAHLKLNAVNKVYTNGFQAVHNVDLDVREGEFMVLVGPSGCAKSTTLRMIAGLENVSSGEIRIGDRVVNNLAPGKRGVSMVFQNYALYPHMKVHRNLSFGLRLKKTPKDEIIRATDEVSGVLEISDLLERLPKQLSGGQAQRVALGRSLIKQPDVFLFDEPLSNLDAKLRASMRVRITDLHKRLRDEGRPATVVYVTHDQVEAMTMGDRICVMNQGRIMQVADPITLYERPDNAFVAGFIGMPEMNLIKASLFSESSVITLGIGTKTITLTETASKEFPSVADAKGVDVTIGLRPQHISITPPNTANTVTGTITNMEFIGHEINVYVEVENQELVAVVPSEQFDWSYERGNSIGLKPHSDRIHLFDAVTGKTLKNH
ncbi:MAG: ABC transporter ATP-binding protein [Granulosicoccus sp.]